MGNMSRALLDETSSPETTAAWMLAHRELSRLARERAAADVVEGCWLLAALRSVVHVHLGFGSFSEYVERLFGYKPRTTREKLRVAEALEALPATAHALQTGSLSWCAARELTRVATRETEQTWLDTARGRTLRELEELVAGKLPGDDPDAPNRPDARRHVLRFEVCAETYATFREAVQALRRASNAPLDDDATLLALARHALGGPQDDGRASYQIVVSVCKECGSGAQLGAGQVIPLSPELVAMARCDGQQLGEIQASNSGELAAHVGRAEDPHEPQAPHVPRAKQTIPPALRRAVLARDQHRCRAPGCKNATFLDLHHVQPRCQGGANSAGNLITLCGVHHRAVHRGALVIQRGASGDARFHHADGSAYGNAADPLSLDVHAKVLGALRGLGFGASEARGALAELHGAKQRGATPEVVLREALALLTSPRAAQTI